MTETLASEPKKKYSLFEIAGPIMVGPSSSHTAGACKIGQIAQALFHHKPDKVVFELHGSFGTVYKGHSTDRALLAGIMKFKTSDLRLKDSFNLAKQHKIKYSFAPKNLGEKYHPNTVRIIMIKKDAPEMRVIGSSIGGGMVKIVKIDEFDVVLHGVAGQFKTLVIWHKHSRKVLEDLREKLERNLKVRIHDIQTTTVGKKSISILNFEGRDLKLREVLRLEKISGIEHVRSLTQLITD